MQVCSCDGGQLCSTPRHISLQVEFCGELPVQYWLELRNTDANASKTFGPYFFPQNGSDVEMGIKMQSNSAYSYTVTASNRVGNSTSAPQALCKNN